MYLANFKLYRIIYIKNNTALCQKLPHIFSWKKFNSQQVKYISRIFLDEKVWQSSL